MRTKTLCGVDQARPRARHTALRCAAHDIPGARRCRVPAALPGLAMRTTTLCGVDKAIVHAALPAHPPRHSHVFGHSCRRTLSLPTTLLTHGCTCTCRDRRSDQLQPQSPARSQPAVQSARFVALSTVAQGLADLTAQFKLLLEAELQCALCPTADNTDKAAGSSTHAHLLQCPSCRAIFQAVVVGTAQTPPERVPHISLSVWCSLETSAELLPSVMWATRQRKWCHMPSRLLCSTARTCWPCIKPTTGMSDHPSRATHRVVGMVHWQSALLYLNDANNPFQSTPRLVFVSEAIPTTKPLPAPSAPLNIHS